MPRLATTAAPQPRMVLPAMVVPPAMAVPPAMVTAPAPVLASRVAVSMRTVIQLRSETAHMRRVLKALGAEPRRFLVCTREGSRRQVRCWVLSRWS